MTDPNRPPRPTSGSETTPPSDATDPLPGGRSVRHYMKHWGGRALFGAETLVPMLVFVLVIVALAFMGGFAGATSFGVLLLLLAAVAGVAVDYTLWARKQGR